ncbi:uncharacterized protein BDZ99DRAFT_393444 [Mytilinidion resinicola]|uniref:Serine hydrolase domain-containing protein n=1 Tax=Mytilinidion resinicola TaxID=574789 RepID=A0A6A6YEP7_9PEZI|nr:uncharacterized protein BDZ99DRAFT_393444 [Mytilinidion resinicola]KAF2807003.1 hypothetical protein BDZ99DRAFT_393444 [Mytilinidion resinicola]
MRFLCLHGMGTNNKVFEIQTAALRYALGDHHTFEFVEGVVPAAMNDSLKGFFPATDGYFQYFEENDAASCLKAVNDLEAFVAVEGPFDGVLAFSQGASVATTLMVRSQQRDRPGDLLSPVFKCAVFLGAAVPCDAARLDEGVVREMTHEADGEVIQLPTTHIWGEKDGSPYPPQLAALCASRQKNVYVHGGGHEVPSSNTDEALRESVRVIKRAISMAQYKQA